MVKTGKIKDLFLTLCIRKIWLLSAHHGIDLQISHIPGCYNIIADSLSRIFSTSSVNESILKELRDQYILHLISSLLSSRGPGLHIDLPPGEPT